MIGYLDLPSGISGDMFLGCLVDAGWPVEELKRTLLSLRLPSDSWNIEAREVMKGPLRAMLVDVRVPEDAAGFTPIRGLPLMAGVGQHPGHEHRNLEDIRAIIRAADLPAVVKDRAIAVFTRLAAAEAKVHGAAVEAVHFHEVGALDAIVDIVGTVAGLHALGIEQLYASAVPLGDGWAKTAHGQIPLPAPATLEILAAANAPSRPAPGPGELVTPTGAALLAELAVFRQPKMRIERVALGAGQKNFDWPNLARLWLGTPDETPSALSPLVQIDTNIDDMNPQLYSAIADRLFAAGARDVWLTPIQMKKGRPAVMLSVLADAKDERMLSEMVLTETTTLGVRVSPVHRHEARREMRQVQTEYGAIAVKVKWVNQRLCGATPEYEDCRQAAESRGVAIRLVYESALAAAHQALERV
jgi:hypothetical protein